MTGNMENMPRYGKQLTRLVMHLAPDTNYGSKPRHLQPEKWKSPPPGTLKINIDASFSSEALIN